MCSPGFHWGLMSCNSEWLSNLICYDSSRSALVEVMACCLHGNKPLPQPKLTPMDTSKYTSMNIQRFVHKVYIPVGILLRNEWHFAQGINGLIFISWAPPLGWRAPRLIIFFKLNEWYLLVNEWCPWDCGNMACTLQSHQAQGNENCREGKKVRRSINHKWPFG